MTLNLDESQCYWSTGTVTTSSWFGLQVVMCRGGSRVQDDLSQFAIEG